MTASAFLGNDGYVELTEGLDERSKEGNFLELTGRVDQSLMLPMRKLTDDRGGQRLGPHLLENVTDENVTAGQGS